MADELPQIPVDSGPLLPNLPASTGPAALDALRVGGGPTELPQVPVPLPFPERLMILPQYPGAALPTLAALPPMSPDSLPRLPSVVMSELPALQMPQTAVPGDLPGMPGLVPLSAPNVAGQGFPAGYEPPQAQDMGLPGLVEPGGAAGGFPGGGGGFDDLGSAMRELTAALKGSGGMGGGQYEKEGVGPYADPDQWRGFGPAPESSEGYATASPSVRVSTRAGLRGAGGYGLGSNTDDMTNFFEPTIRRPQTEDDL
jgi:hypothetical protein